MQMDVTSTEISQSWIFPEYLLIFLAKLEMDNITDLRVLFNDTALKKLASLNTKYVLTLRERIRMVMTSYKQPKCVPIFKGEANYEYWFYFVVVGGDESKNRVFVMLMALICFREEVLLNVIQQQRTRLLSWLNDLNMPMSEVSLYTVQRKLCCWGP